MKRRKLKRVQLVIGDDQIALLRRLHDEMGSAMSELVRRALDRTYAKRGDAR